MTTAVKTVRPLFTKLDIGYRVNNWFGVYAGVSVGISAHNLGMHQTQKEKERLIEEVIRADDYSEQTSKAVDYLNSLCSGGVRFEWVNEDLILTPKEV